MLRIRHSPTLLILLLCGMSFAATPQLQQIGMVTIPGPPGFDSLVFAKGMLVMSHPAASSVDVFDPVRRRIVAQITGFASPQGMAVDESNGRLYVADSANHSITVIATDTWKVSGNIPVSGAPDCLVLERDGTRLFWSDPQNRTLSIADVNTRQNVSTVPLEGTPRYLAYDPDHGLLFATLQDLDQVIAVDPQLRVAKRFTLQASQPTGLLYDARFNKLYVAVRKAVLALDADSGAEVDRVTAAPGVDMLWLDYESRKLYAAAPNSLLVMRASDGRLINDGETNPQIKGHSVAFDPMHKMLLLPGGREGKSQLLLMRPFTAAQPETTRAARAEIR